MRLSRVFPKRIRPLFFLIVLFGLPQALGARNDYEEALGAMKQELRMFPEDSNMRDIVHRVETQRAAP